jgi:hypothetical protein
MATSDSPAIGVRTGWLSRLLASRWSLVVAGIVALALIVTTALAAVSFFAPQTTVLSVGTPMPSSFALDLVPASSPFVSRGGTATVVVHATPTDDLDRLELWADDKPYIVIDDPELLPLDTQGKFSLSLDYVPMRAGAHTLLVRAVDATGLVAQSSPMAIPTLDLPQDTGAVLQGNTMLSSPDLSFRSAPGDTLQSIVDRLGLAEGELHTWSSLPNDDAILAAGTRLVARMPALDQLVNPKYRDISWASEITATRTDCIVVVTSKTSHTMRIYGGPGNAALGDVKVDSPLVLANLPIGPTTLVGLEPGVTNPSTKEGFGPTIPVTVTIPDTCARSGWEGDAYVNGGILITDMPVEDAYMYISVDKGTWKRFPSEEGSSFGSGSGILNDLRGFIDLDHYDQIDLEVWSARDGEALRRASGAFCRGSMSNPDPGGSSGSGGECQPAGASPGTIGAAVAANFTLKAEIVNKSNATPSFNVSGTGDPTGSFITMSGASDLILTTDAADFGYNAVMYQFSYFPLSATSPLVDPPGVFHTITAVAGSKTTVQPWAWHDMKLTDKDLAGTDKLALDDELALATAKENLKAGRNLVDDLYIRAIAIKSTYEPITTLGGSSNSINVLMPSSLDGTWPKIAFPKVSLVPGVDQSASFAASWMPGSGWDQSVQRYANTISVNDNCFEVSDYPNPNTWNSNSYLGPHFRPAWAVEKYGTGTDTTDKTTYDYWGPQKAGDTQVSPGYQNGTDLAFAKAAWPRQDVIYCMDDAASGLRWTEAYEANKEANECGFGCVMSFVIYGAMEGWVIGGPYGALIGAIAGLAVGLISTQNPQFYADLMAIWDKIAGVYNAVFDAVWDFVAATNLFCIGMKALAGEDAGSFCDSATQAIGSAVIYYYTGLPPHLATSAELDALADGNAEALVVALLEAALAEFGIPLTCATMSLDSTETAALNKLGDTFGVDSGAAQDSSGNLSACGAIARAFVKELRANMKTRTESLMSAITGEPAIPGLELSPISDVRASVSILATAPNALGTQTCPIIVNQTVTQDGSSYRFPAQTGTLKLRVSKKPIDGSPTPAPQWEGTLPVGVNPQVFFEAIPETGPKLYDWYHREWTVIDPARNGITVTKADTTAKYLSVVIDSPCFDSQYAMTASKYGDGSPGLIAFAVDSRPAVAYY